METIYDNPFATLAIARAAAERLSRGGAGQMVEKENETVLERMQANARRWDNLPERAAIDNDGEIRDEILPAVAGQQEFLPRLLNGSQAKTAFALRMNAERMIREDGLNCTGFLTLTVGNFDRDGHFIQVKDAGEASRRINNLNRRVLADLFIRAIIVTERHKSGAIHFHILGTLQGKPDIRTGLNFEQIRAKNYKSASEELRGLWKFLRDKLPEYGFGRAELLPVQKTGEAVASYVSKYIEKNVCNRTAADKNKKLVRYLGWEKKQLKANEFGWAGKKAVAWRAKARALAGLVNIAEPEQAAAALGPRWAWKLSNLWRATLGDDLINGFNWSYPEKEFMRGQLANECLAWARRQDKPHGFGEIIRDNKATWPEYYPKQFRQN